MLKNTYIISSAFIMNLFQLFDDQYEVKETFEDMFCCLQMY